jgi:hypothetical protein
VRWRLRYGIGSSGLREITVNPFVVVAAALVLCAFALGLLVGRRWCPSRAIVTKEPSRGTRPTVHVARTFSDPDVRRVTADPIILGREPGAHGLPVEDPSGEVSREHCEIAWDADRACFSVTDLGSQNGTRVTGDVACEPGVTQFVRPGAVVYLGRTGPRVGLDLA